MAGFDGAGPRILGIFSRRFGTPIVVNVLSGVVATILMWLAFNLTSGNANSYFNAVLGLAISTTTISYLAIFPAIIRLRYTMSDVPRPFRIPFGMAGVWICGVLTELWALFATIVLLWPGLGVDWFGQHGKPDAALSYGLDRLHYELTQLLPLVALFAVGILFYLAGANTRRQVADIPMVPEETQATPALV